MLIRSMNAKQEPDNRCGGAGGGAAAPRTPSGCLEQFMTGAMKASQVQGMFAQIKGAVLERSLGDEMGRGGAAIWAMRPARQAARPGQAPKACRQAPQRLERRDGAEQ